MVIVIFSSGRPAAKSCMLVLSVCVCVREREIIGSKSMLPVVTDVSVTKLTAFVFVFSCCCF